MRSAGGVVDRRKTAVGVSDVAGARCVVLSVTCVTRPRRTSACVSAYIVADWSRRSSDSPDGATMSGAPMCSLLSTSSAPVYPGPSVCCVYALYIIIIIVIISRSPFAKL